MYQILSHRWSYLMKSGHTSQESFWIAPFPLPYPNPQQVLSVWLTKCSVNLIPALHLLHYHHTPSPLHSTPGGSQQPLNSTPASTPVLPRSRSALWKISQIMSPTYSKPSRYFPSHLTYNATCLRQPIRLYVTWPHCLFLWFHILILHSLFMAFWSHYLAVPEDLQIYFFSGIFVLLVLFHWNAFLLDQMSSFHLIIFDPISPPQTYCPSLLHLK